MSDEAKRMLEVLSDLASCAHEKTEPHTCPFKADVHNDSETLCTCCEQCEHECLMDI